MFGLDAETDVPAGSGTRLWGDGFEVETMINVRIAQAGWADFTPQATPDSKGNGDDAATRRVEHSDDQPADDEKADPHDSPPAARRRGGQVPPASTASAALGTTVVYCSSLAGNMFSRVTCSSNKNSISGYSGFTAISCRVTLQ